MQKEIRSLNELFAELERKSEKSTLWFGIAGTWAKTNEEIEHDVRESVREIYLHNGGIVSGGALSVDFFATDEALLLDPTAEHIKIFLPVTLERYATHYRKRAEEGVITQDQAETLIKQLEEVKKRNPSAIIENALNTSVDPTTYFERNTKVIEAADALLGFQVNESKGTQDTIDKALAQSKPVFVRKYIID
ncbi:MAG: hypothetical protein WCT28_00680 [Patescibacteria group bacterium]|jgi:hypothetical protein